VRSRVSRAGTFSLSFLLLAAPPVSAQAPPLPSPLRREAPPPRSGIAQDFMTWLRHLNGTGNNHRRATSSLPLPRPRPAELKSETIESSKAPAELSPETIEKSEAPAQPAPASDESEKEKTSAPLND
jgi:hypothetical protein